ncbi:hypothetical protein, partial [Alistipes shahii]|uniref:hypothetical protein n=1 Tax=Alistipes shahii TaxID=328814 RepID=UPI00197C11E2
RDKSEFVVCCIRFTLFCKPFSGRDKLKKSPVNGLERTGADIGTEASQAVVYCGRNKRKRL